MKLGCDLVQAALAAQFDGAEISGSGEFELERPLLWSPEQQAAAGRLYVLDSADAAPLRADSLTVYAGGAAHPGSGCCACIGAPAAQVFNFLQQLFDRCGNNWAYVPRDWDAPCKINFFNITTGNSYSTGRLNDETLEKAFLGDGGKIL